MQPTSNSKTLETIKDIETGNNYEDIMLSDLKPSASLQKAIDEIERGEVVRYCSDDPIAEMMRDLKS